MGEESAVKGFRTLFDCAANNSYDCFHFNHGVSTNLVVKEEGNVLISAADTIVRASCFVGSYHLLSDLNWTRLADRRTKQMEALMFKAVNGQLPEYISERFKNTNTIHRCNLRDSELNLFILRPNSEALKKSFR